MSQIATSDILSLSFFTVAPIARAAGNGRFLTGQAQALAIAGEQHAANFAARQSGEPAPPPRLVAFDAKGNLLDPGLRRGSLFDILA